MPRTRVADDARSSARADRPHLILVGMMGSGKTTVGRRLADRLGRRFVDTDDLVVERTGSSVREIFEREGEARFRDHEAAALATALSGSEPTVVAAAGGAVLRPANRRLMADRGQVVWLRADPAVLVERAGRGGHRPLLDGDPTAAMTRLADERDALYADAAEVTLDVDELDVDEVVERLAERIA